MGRKTLRNVLLLTIRSLSSRMAYGLPDSSIVCAPSGGGVAMPRLIYGTAWKKGESARLVTEALAAGFRGIDTACQPRHYNERGVGQGISNFIKQGSIRREDLFIQTKFTSLGGQDADDVPYDSEAPLEEQVRQSLQRSLANLGTEYLDSLVLHSPMRSFEDTLRVWRVFESFREDGLVRQLGISNCYHLSVVRRLCLEATVKPSVVQNRFYPETGHDRELRDWLASQGIVYQSFWTLTANPHVIRHSTLEAIASQLGRTPQQVFFRFVMDLGIVPLTGTCDPNHMRQDLQVLQMEKLTPHQFSTISALTFR